MQIKMKPGKPTEPGEYLCLRRGYRYLEYARVVPAGTGLYYKAGLTGCALKHIEDEALFSERIDLVIEE